MAGSSEPAFYLGAKKGAIAQSPIYFLVILRQPLLFADISLLYFQKKILHIYRGEIRIKHYI